MNLLNLISLAVAINPEGIQDLIKSDEEPKCDQCKWRKELWDEDLTKGGHCYMMKEKLMGCQLWKDK